MGSYNGLQINRFAWIRNESPRGTGGKEGVRDMLLGPLVGKTEFAGYQ